VLLLWNPVTGKYNHLSTRDGHGFFEDMNDAIGFYIDASDDYKVIHIKRRFGVYGVYVYSRRLDSWRNIPFEPRLEYVPRSFQWSDGTLCGDTLYFLLCESWVGGINMVICFDVISEEFKEISFPPVNSSGIFFGEVVSVKNQLYMFVSTGFREMQLELWMLEGEHWIQVLASPQIPPIPTDDWCCITHIMTNGNWFMMNNRGKLYEIKMDTKTFECFYPVSRFRSNKGAMFVETVVSPTPLL
jgi:F-box interacting protein